MNDKKGWKSIAVQDLASRSRGSFIDGDWIEAPYITNIGIRLIQTGNIGIGSFVNKNRKFISEESFTVLKCKDVFVGDILICRLADPIGRSCIMPELNCRAITSVDVCILRVDQEYYDRDYVAQSLNQKSFLGACQEKSAGSTRQRISRTNLGKIKVLVPRCKSEQAKIAEILSTVDRAIEETEALIAKQQRIKTGLMQDLLTRGIDEHGNLRSEQTHKFKDSPLGRIPVEWETKRLEGLTTGIGDGIHATPNYSENTNLFFINGNNLDNGTIHLSQNTLCVDEKEYKKYFINLDERTILYSINGTVGNIAFYKNEDVILGKSAAYIKCKKTVNTRLIYYILQSQHTFHTLLNG